MNATPQQIIERIERYSHVCWRGLCPPGAAGEIKWHCKYARQNGIHVSPTFMVNGLVQPDLGSGDDISVWAARIMAVRLSRAGAVAPATRHQHLTKKAGQHVRE
jgi:hypothetical protein